MGERRAGRERRAAVRHRRQRLVVDRDQRGGVLGDVARLRDHDRDRLADEGHLVLGEHERRDVRRQLRGAELQRQPFVGQKRREMSASVSTACTPGSRGRRGVDAADGGMRVRAAHERRLQRAGEAQVVDEARAAREQRPVLDPLDRAADGTRFGGHEPAFFCRPLAERGPIGSGWNGPSRMSR